jgi:hypothetical protein
MKILVICLSFIASAAFAQTMGIKDIPANGDTTIKIQKGAQTDSEYQITTGEEEIEGDPAPLLKDARDNWKKACADWKKETKESNSKENQILSVNCGSMKCGTVAMESTCRSTGTHKMKVKIK